MSPVLFLYAAILLAVVIGLWAAYRLLGTPSRLTPDDYRLVLEDLVQSVERAAAQLRAALNAGQGDTALQEAAGDSRKIFQTAYFQTLRLRPLSGADSGAGVRTALGQACEAYEWASRMAESESIGNPAVRASALQLLDAGDAAHRRAAASLTALPAGSGRESTPPSPPARA